MDPSVTARVFAEIDFDYIVIGGGNTGLPIAVRLSEDNNVTVGVLEAGEYLKDDPMIDTPATHLLLLANQKYDWMYASVPQTDASGAPVPMPRGKMLGGSSGINFLAVHRSGKAEYDAWETIAGSPGVQDAEGWNWDGMLPYFRKSEGVADLPDEVIRMSEKGCIDESAQTLSDVVGVDGPLKTSFNRYHTDIVPALVQGWNELGVKTNPNFASGDNTGMYSIRRAFDPTTGKRTYAANTYYAPVEGRENLKVLTGAHVSKIVFADAKDRHGDLVATGVEFVCGGQTFVAHTKREVILSAGVVGTPQILELSGIGNKTLLTSLGIETLIDLPGVGENLRDHWFAPIECIVKPGIRTFDELMLNPEFMKEQQELYATTKDGWLATLDSPIACVPLKTAVSDSAELDALLARFENVIATGAADGKLTPLQEAQYRVQLQWLKEGNTADLEIIVFGNTLVPLPSTQGRNGFVAAVGIQHPFGRGSIHITSKDPLTAPDIDPKYFSSDIDLDILAYGYRYLEKLLASKAVGTVLDAIVFPPAPLPNFSDVKEHIKRFPLSGGHIHGTAAMARKEVGGVVSPSLKVYGSANLRVADASILPLPISGHFQATMYALAEKAVDLIKKEV